MSQAVTTRTFARRKANGERIAMLTAYDYTSARLLDAAGIDAILVGDSLGMVMQGHDSPLPVTMDEMLYHTRCVRRGVTRAMVILDMPFASYRVSLEETMRNACRAVQEGGAQAVKIEGGPEACETIDALAIAGIPVLAHIGMMPSHVHEHGLGLAGRNAAAMHRVLEAARSVEAAGAFAVVLENVAASLAGTITERVGIPTIGIGSGPYCDGQVLVLQDLLGQLLDFQPPFARRYAELGQATIDAVTAYRGDVEEGRFPGGEETRDLDDAGQAVLAQVLAEFEDEDT